MESLRSVKDAAGPDESPEGKERARDVQSPASAFQEPAPRLPTAASADICAALAEESVFTRDSTLSAFARVVPEPCLVLDEERRILCRNRRMADLLGESAEETAAGDLPPDVAIGHANRLDEAYRTGKRLQYESDRGGARRLIHLVPVKDHSGAVRRLVAFSIAITDGLVPERAFDGSESTFRDRVETIEDFLFTLDAEGTITYISPVVETVLGHRAEELTGCHWRILFPPEDHPLLSDRVRQVLDGVGSVHEYSMRHKSGELVRVRISSAPVRRNGVIVGLRGEGSDITARKTAELELAKRAEQISILHEQARADALELRARLTRIRRAEAEKDQLLAQLQHARRMEAIGTLTRGIAHDFNNILTPVIMGAQMIIDTLPDGHPAGSLAARIITAGERAQELVKQLLARDRQDDIEPDTSL